MVVCFFAVLLIWTQPYSTLANDVQPTNEDGIIYKGNFMPWDEYIHYPNQWAEIPEVLMKPPKLPELEKPDPDDDVYKEDSTPDFRVPEKDSPYLAKNTYYQETGRYYRLNPANMGKWRSQQYYEEVHRLNCYCVTVYKKFTPLGMGAVLTFRHILTTAMSTDVVVSKYRNKKTLENILGAWYNTDFAKPDIKVTNTSYYMTPARVIYHPSWNSPERLNRSFPIPCSYDLALWTSTFSFFVIPDKAIAIKDGPEAFNIDGFGAALCNRWSNKLGGKEPPIYRVNTDIAIIVSFQMVMDINRIPFPWFKYAIKIKELGAVRCPKTEWDWYNCIEWHGPVMSLGLEPGAALHIATTYKSWRYPGLAGLNSFSMKLRSKFMTNYFTVIDRHPVLDFLYDAMKSRLKSSWIDWRFMETKEREIRLRPDRQYINQQYTKPKEWSENYKYEPVWN